jgi:hypothetical protein
MEVLSCAGDCILAFSEVERPAGFSFKHGVFAMTRT